MTGAKRTESLARMASNQRKWGLVGLSPESLDESIFSGPICLCGILSSTWTSWGLLTQWRYRSAVYPETVPPAVPHSFQVSKIPEGGADACKLFP